MGTLAPSDGLEKPPGRHLLVEARRTLKARFAAELAQADSSIGATLAATRLLDAAKGETDAAYRWLLLDEARRLGVNAGQPEIVSAAVKLASASYDFDTLEVEAKSLAEIPLRALSPQKAARLAETAESLANRAEADGRLPLAVSAQTLAVRAWQRAGAREAAFQAAARHDALEIARVAAGRR